MKRRFLSILLSLIMIVTCLPLSIVHAFSDGEQPDAKTTPTISVENAYAKAGTTVDVNINISNNSGIAGARITIAYDAGLTLTDAVSGAVFETLDYTRPGNYSSPCNFNWDSENAVATDDGTILTLTFAVADNASVDDNLTIDVSYVYGDIYDVDLNSILVNMESGYIDVIDYIYGDVNDDGTVNGKDVTLIRRHNAGGYDVTINEAAADVNCDGTINGKDVTIIRRYIAGGYGIELPIVPPVGCNHNMEHIEEMPATCTEDGNIEYWLCTVCGKYFSDADGSHEITQASTIIPATGHSFSEEWTFDSTYHWHASTCGHDNVVTDRAEHSFDSEGICTVCGYSNNTPDPSKPYRIDFRLIEYNANQGDDYIGTQAIDNSANETHVYFSATETFELVPISCPGYEFLGWYTPDGERMTSVPVGTNHDLILYARWSEITYNITYRVYLSPVGAITEDRYLHYTVSKGLQDLPNPTINNYEFLGWYKDDGTEVTRIPVGTTGDIVLNAYWTSFRNMAKAVDHIGDPTVIVDNVNGRIYFAYELGTIENVPISDAIWTIQGVSGIEQLLSTTVSTTITQTRADEIAEIISNTTVDSNTWRLSEDWNDTIHIDEGWAQQHGMTVEEAETILKGDSNTYSLTTSNGGSNTSTSNTGTTTVTYDSRNDETGIGATYNEETSASYHYNEHETDTLNTSLKTSLGVKAGCDLAGVEAGIEAGIETGQEWGYDEGIEIGGKTSSEFSGSANQNLHTGTDTTTVDTHTNSSVSSWNNSETSEHTQSASQSNTVSQTLSDVLSSTYNIGQSYIHGSSQSSEQGFSNSNSYSVNSATTFTYATSETVTTTRTYSTDGKSDGWYRLVIAGRVHVFGVVGYDVASKSYFVYTYSIMEDETYDFLDYSPYSSFDDNDDFAALPFEVPYDICEYVHEMTLETEGLLFRTNTNAGTATVIGYTGTDEEVHIPSFYSNGGYAYKVTGISESAFAGKDIRAIILSEYIDVIPDNAFKNCTSLESVFGRFTQIGSEAFSGCANLSEIELSSYITYVGEDAFLGVPQVTLYALNQTTALYKAYKLHPDVESFEQLKSFARDLTQTAAASILSSGADSMVLDLSPAISGTIFSLNVPSIDRFELLGGKNSYPDMLLNSEAGTTVLRNTTIADCTRIPLVIASDNIILDTVSVTSPSFALLAKSQNVNITMVRDNVLASESGNAVVCKDPTLISEISTRATVGVLDVSGNMYVCGAPPITGSEYLDVTNGEIIYIGDDQFSSLIRGCFTVNFNANGGDVATASKDIEFGAVYGELPVPTRATYDFVGWFTEAEGGTMITEDTVSTAIYDQTLYAHWELKQYTVYFNANGGSCETVSFPAIIGCAPVSLPTPTRTGFTFVGWFTLASSWGTQVTLENWNSVIGSMDPVTLVNNGLTLYAMWSVNSYTVSWSTGTGYSITVNRVSSPNAGASTNTLSNGATVYYGDVLTVTYTPATGYSIATHGATSITVTGNIDSSTIYATASANSYTYNIVYRSANGTSLGSTTITRTWGTTVTVTAPDKSSQGYTTPASQTVTWDSTTPKTITFTYGVTSVGFTTKTGTIDTSPKLSYSARLEYQNRTATSVQVRVVWTTTIGAGSWTVYGQRLNASTNAGSSSATIAAFNAWENSVSYDRSATGTTGWMTVNLSTTNATTASVNIYYYQFNSNGTDMTQGYGACGVNTTWTLNIPAY